MVQVIHLTHQSETRMMADSKIDVLLSLLSLITIPFEQFPCSLQLFRQIRSEYVGSGSPSTQKSVTRVMAERHCSKKLVRESTANSVPSVICLKNKTVLMVEEEHKQFFKYMLSSFENILQGCHQNNFQKARNLHTMLPCH